MSFQIPNGIMNPGYAVASQLQEILARKTKDKHDALLAGISQQNADTSRMQAESYEKQREAEARWRDAQADKSKVDDLSMGQPLDDDTVDWLKQTKRGGLVKSTPTGETEPYQQNNDGSIYEGPVQKMDNTYAGSPGEQKEVRQTAAIRGLIGNPEFQKADALTKTLMLREHGVNNITPDQLGKAENTSGGIYVLDEASGTVKKVQDLPNGEIRTMTRNRAPVGGGGGANVGTWTFTEAFDDKNQKIPGYMSGLNNKTGASQLFPLAKGVTTTGLRVGSNPPSTTDETRREALYQQKAAQLTGLLQQNSRPTTKKLTDEQVIAQRAAQRVAMNELISLSGATPGFQRMMQSIVADPKTAKLTTQKIIETVNARAAQAGQPPLDEAEVAQLRRTLPTILGK